MSGQMLSVHKHNLNFCPVCGSALVERWAFGRSRKYCDTCERVVFQEHKVAAAVLVTNHEGQVLLVQRAGPPLQGRWSLPAGFVDDGETPEDAARRECKEETGLEIAITGLLSVVAGREHERGADIVIVYQGRITDGELAAGDDAAAARFFSVRDLPPLAFRATDESLKAWKAMNPEDAQ